MFADPVKAIAGNEANGSSPIKNAPLANGPKSMVPGSVIDGQKSAYSIVSQLGKGGMGTVFLAKDKEGNEVALKAMDASTVPPRLLTAAKDKFLHEAEMAQRIVGEHVVRYLDRGLFDETPFVVMELLRGANLAEEGEGGKRIYETLPDECRVPLVADLLEGLANAHAAGVTHRDLKDENVFLVRSGEDGEKRTLKIIDFGSGVTGEQDAESTEHAMTRLGVSVVTPHTCAPEQVLPGPQRSSPRVDVFSAGILMYQLCTGTFPYAHPSDPNDYVFYHDQKLNNRPNPPLPFRAGIPEHLRDGLTRIILKALDPKPENRYENAIFMRNDFTNLAPNLGTAFMTPEQWAGIVSARMDGRVYDFGVLPPVSPTTSSVPSIVDPTKIPSRELDELPETYVEPKRYGWMVALGVAALSVAAILAAASGDESSRAASRRHNPAMVVSADAAASTSTDASITDAGSDASVDSDASDAGTTNDASAQARIRSRGGSTNFRPVAATTRPCLEYNRALLVDRIERCTNIDPQGCRESNAARIAHRRRLLEECRNSLHPQPQQAPQSPFGTITGSDY